MIRSFRRRRFRRRRGLERFVPGNRLRRLADGPDCFAAMLDAIASARTQILLEMYWFDDDAIGQTFARALEAACARGVEVALVYDAVGSFATSNAFFEGLARAGVKVVEYGPVTPWRRRFRWDRISRRDHRKMLICDGKLAVTGGVNIARPWMASAEGGADWRDESVLLEGPAVNGLIDGFMRVWKSQHGVALRSLRGQAQKRGGQRARVIVQSHILHRRGIVNAYLRRLRRARRSIWIANSYFLPDRRILSALRRAALRGVDVRILLPGQSDVSIVRHGSRAVWPRLLASGVRIFEWPHNVLHSKVAVVDGQWSTVGTFNLDYRSIRYNLEVNLAILDREFSRELTAALARDLDDAQEITRESLESRSWWARIVESIWYRLRFLL